MNNGNMNEVSKDSKEPKNDKKTANEGISIAIKQSKIT